MIAPQISDGAVDALVQGYLAMRSIGGRGVKTISATPRQLESLIRISQVGLLTFIALIIQWL